MRLWLRRRWHTARYRTLEKAGQIRRRVKRLPAVPTRSGRLPVERGAFSSLPKRQAVADLVAAAAVACQESRMTNARPRANQAFQSIAGSLFGGGGNFLSGLFGGGRAGGGPVMAGRSYMVGENGPEMVTMGGNGYVTNTAALRSAVQTPSVSINIDARGAVEGTAAMISRAIQQAAPAIVKQSVLANRAAGARGY